jgi:hypothetical protein
MVKTLLAYAGHPALGKCVGIWRLKRCVNDVKALGLENEVKGSREPAIVVVDQEPLHGSLFFERPHHLSYLLGDPPTVWTCSYSGQMDALRTCSMMKST